ncbi:MAG: 30S ribosomal protein S20 [Alphaproteobacteria bacterium]|nr:30S ribosomal protein S20 [Alphaproteobacteria bacterium]MCB9791630.1 30S ribosomal protein S20 [Alphaproteobacteria bacterium]
MANHASALKRMRQNAKRRAYNRHYRSAMRTQIKKLRALIEEGDLASAEAELPRTVSIIQRLASKQILHKANASRRVARLYAAVNKLRADQGAEG